MAEWAKDRAFIRLMTAIACLVLALIVALCISICMRSNMHEKYSVTIARLQAHAYQNMTEMTQLFARIDEPDVDVRGKLLPTLKSHYAAVAAINDALGAVDQKNTLLSAEQIAAFDAAFEQYETAYRQGSATGLAKADLLSCMEDVQEMVDVYNAPAEDEKDQVLIIDAASGKAVNK